MTSKFIHLRLHTAYSLAEGGVKIFNKKKPDAEGFLTKFCIDNNVPAVALTDTNNLFGGADFSYHLSDYGIQPLVGTQLSVNFKTGIDVANIEKEFPNSLNWLPAGCVYHDATRKVNFLSQLILIVKNEVGYRNLSKIISRSFLKAPEGCPAQSVYEALEKYNEGLICLTAGLKGVIGQAILAGREDVAENELLHLQKIFGDRLYMELHRLGYKGEDVIEPVMIDLAYKHNIPLVATNEVFYLDNAMFRAHDALICITQGAFVENEDRRHETRENYFKTDEQMIELFEDLPEAVENTVKIAKRCAFNIKKSDPLLPHIKKGMDFEEEKQLLIDNSYKGLEIRFVEHEIPVEDRQKYYDAVKFETEVINNMGFPGYFLIVEDFIRWSKENDVPVGPGRGSGAGSTVAWSLRITDLDPFRFGLLFERFLNPDRVNMPDFDIDFCQDRRSEVIKYVQQKYGEDSVSQIITFGKFKSKLVIRDLARVLQFPYSKADMLSKMIPDKALGQPMDLQNSLKSSAEFKEMYDNDEDVKYLIDLGLQIEGLNRHSSTHAAGVLIGDRPIEQLVPLYKDAKSDLPVSEFDMDYIESTGLVKYDFLGLKTLSVIYQAQKLVEKNYGVKLDFDKGEFIKYDDKKTYELFANALTIGIFQLESKGMQKYIADLKPTNIEDIIAMVALYRPGPMDNIPSFINRKHGREKIEYAHPSLEEILEPTYGYMVYQEQVMHISRKLANYTRGEADSLRKAMGKKIAELMAQHKTKFIDGCVANNVSEEIAVKLFMDMEKFASYAFNKAHAACYAIISYQTAYLKANYPVEFMTATFNYDLGNQDKLKLYFEDVNKMGYEILSPDVNKSFTRFTVENGKIRYGLVALKNVGEGFVDEIIAEREAGGEFVSLNDFIQRVARRKSGALNKKMLDGLIKAGALDCLESNRQKLFEGIPSILAYAQSLSKDADVNQSSLFFNEDDSVETIDFKFADCMDWTPAEKLQFESEIIGYNITPNPLKIYEKHIKKLHLDRVGDVDGIKKSRTIQVVGIIENFYKRTSKNGKDYIMLTLGDDFKTVNFMFFQELDFVKKQAEFVEKNPVIVEGDLKKTDDGFIIFGKKISLLKEELGDSLSNIEIEVLNEDSIKALQQTLIKAGAGQNSVSLITLQNGKKITMTFPTKYNISDEIRVMINNLNGVKIV